MTLIKSSVSSARSAAKVVTAPTRCRHSPGKDTCGNCRWNSNIALQTKKILLDTFRVETFENIAFAKNKKLVFQITKQIATLTQKLRINSRCSIIRQATA